MRTSILVTGSVAALLLLSSCRKQDNPNETARLGNPGIPNLSVQAGGYHGNHFAVRFTFPDSLPWRSGTTAYNVTYQDGVTVISRDDTMRHLVAIRRDGSYVFDSSASQIANLEPGERAPAFRPGAVHGGGCERHQRRLPDQDRTGENHRRHQRWPAGGHVQDRFQQNAGSNRHPQGMADFDVDFGGYNYHVKFTPGNDRIDVQATIKFGGSQGTLAYEGVGYLSNFVSTIKMQIKDGELTNLSFTNSEP